MLDEEPFPRAGGELKTDGDKAGQIYERIKVVLLSYRLAPSTFLNIRTIAQALKVSPTPVREALIRLANEEIVLQAPAGRGFFSRAPALDELAAEYEAAAIAAVSVLFLRQKKLVGFKFAAMPREAPVVSTCDPDAAVVAAWVGFVEAFYSDLIRLSENRVLQKSAARFLDATRFLRVHDLQSADRIRERMEELRRLSEHVEAGQMANAVACVEQLCTAQLSRLPKVLQSVLRKISTEAVTLEAMMLERRR